MTQTRDIASQSNKNNEELIDTLIAISVVAKRLAGKLRQESEKSQDDKNVKTKKEF